MKLKQTTLATAIAATLALGMSGQAAASVYARSYLEVDNLHVLVSPTAGATIRSFTFNTNISAGLNNGSAAAEILACGGSPGLPGVGNSCNAGPTRLDAPVVNAPGSTVLQANNAFVFNGPGANQYSNADTVIWTAGLTGDTTLVDFDGPGPNPAVPVPTTHTEQIAESEIQGGSVAAAQSLIDSITGFTFAFSTTNAGTLTVTLDAVQNMLAAINDPTGINQNALATMDVSLKLQKDGVATNFVQFSPNGQGTGCIDISSDLTCTSLLDPFNLSLAQAGTTSNNDSDTLINSGAFGVQMGITGAGDWTLTLTQKTSTVVSRREQAVPEPGVLALLGIGLAGLSFMSRRRKAA